MSTFPVLLGRLVVPCGQGSGGRPASRRFAPPALAGRAVSGRLCWRLPRAPAPAADVRTPRTEGGELPIAVAIAALRVVRGGRVVIDALDLELPAGALVGLLGPSGCGKTTLMRSIVGVQRVAGGDVRVLGLPAGHPSLRARVGYVTQAPSVYDDLTVVENLRYFAAVVGVRRRALAAEVARALDQVGLADHAGAQVRHLSGGQVSRVSLAAALVGRPELLVLDEPTVGLDPVLRRDLWAIFRGLGAAGTTLLVSSHVMDEAVRCDRIVLMRDGAVLADGSLADVLGRTGAADAEGAFLALVGAAGAGSAR